MDFTPILIWYVIIFVFGLVGWLLADSLLRFLPDRGFALARPLGLLTTGYILWLGGTFRLLQNNVGGTLVALGLVLALGIIWRRQQADRLSMLAWLRREWRYALTIELLFALAFVGWAGFKAYNPNLETAGGEKWMEIAFINGVLRSPHFPPQDPWLSGFAISYYYFGYVLMAMLTRLTGLAPTIAFNLYIPTLLALTLTAACGIGANLVSLYQQNNPAKNQNIPSSIHQLQFSAILTGLLAALFVAILGNLEGLLEVLHKAALLPANFWLWLDIRDLKVPPTGPAESWMPDRFIWWWRGSRVLTDYTLTGQEQEVIDEFPFFSFLLGDVHPHVLGLPFVLLVVGLALNLVSSYQSAVISQQLSVIGEQIGGRRPALSLSNGSAVGGLIDKIRKILENNWSELTGAMGGQTAFVLYALCLGALSFLNTWDFPIYLGVVGLSYFIWQTYRRGDWPSAVEPALVGVVFLGLAGAALYLPFYATFQSQARGILPNLWNPTRLPQFLVFFGPFLVVIMAYLLVLSRQASPVWRSYLGSSLILTVLGPILLMLLALTGVLFSPAGRGLIEGLLNDPQVQQIIGEATLGSLVQASLWRRILNPWTFLFVGGLMGWALALWVGTLAGWNVERLSSDNEKAKRRGGEEARRRRDEEARMASGQPTFNLQPSTSNLQPLISTSFTLILILVGLALPLAVEFIYLRDNFGIRMNTIFKFYFQAWVLLALAAAFAVYYVAKHLRGTAAIAWLIGLGLLVAGGLVYPLLAIPNKADFFQNPPRLDGMAWIAQARPGDYAGIQWLNQNAIGDDAVVLEAPGAKYAAYQYTSRVSAMTGLPTLLGWGGHQSQWRGNYDEPARREPDIETLYNTSNLGQAQILLDKYNITYVYVGPLERERYAPPGLRKFAQLMEVMFQQDDVTIYQRR